MKRIISRLWRSVLAAALAYVFFPFCSSSPCTGGSLERSRDITMHHFSQQRWVKSFLHDFKPNIAGKGASNETLPSPHTLSISDRRRSTCTGVISGRRVFAQPVNSGCRDGGDRWGARRSHGSRRTFPGNFNRHAQQVDFLPVDILCVVLEDDTTTRPLTKQLCCYNMIWLYVYMVSWFWGKLSL